VARGRPDLIQITDVGGLGLQEADGIQHPEGRTGRGQPVARCALKVPVFRRAASLGATRNRRTPSFIRLAGRRPRCLWTPISARSAGCAL
jgi:hypothetical protein